MKRRVCSLLILLLCVGAVAGCEEKESPKVNDDTKQTEKTTENKKDVVDNSSCSGLSDCVNKIKLGANLDDVNALIGTDGVQAKDNNKVYEWTLDDENVLKIYYNEKVIAIDSDVKKFESVKDKIDTSSINEIEAKIEEGINYDNVSKLLGNVDGVMIAKNNENVSYRWYITDKNFVIADFSVEDGKCLSIIEITE